jgi:hypothetical protein
MDTKARAEAAEQLECELLAHLERVREHYRTGPSPIDAVAYDADVGGALWLLDVLLDWRDGRIAETAH